MKHFANTSSIRRCQIQVKTINFKEMYKLLADPIINDIDEGSTDLTA